MSNIEFIPANELPTTEASEVDVLCVENGELKLKAGASLGGNTKYDMVIRLVATYDDENGYNETAELIEGSYEEVKQKLDNNMPAIALVIEDGTQLPDEELPWKGVNEGYLAFTRREVFGDDGELVEYVDALTTWGYNGTYWVFADNTVATDR